MMANCQYFATFEKEVNPLRKFALYIARCTPARKKIIDSGKMIEIKTNYSYRKRHPFDLDSLSERELAILEQIKVHEFIVNDLDDQIFKNIFYEVLRKLLDSYKVYFVYYNSRLQKKSRIRSHKKLFYGHYNAIGKANVVESEFDLENDQSMIISLLALQKNNIDYFLKHLLNSALAFGFAIPKGKRSFKINRTGYLESLFNNSYYLENNIRINFLKLLAGKDSVIEFFLRIRTTGRDEEILDIFNKKSNNHSLIESMAMHYMAVASN